MNVPAIRKALESIDTGHRIGGGFYASTEWCRWADALVTVGLRAMHDGCNGVLCERCDSNEPVLRVIADILREAGVEVGE